eukprot:TRINITY_DN21653_c0_g1_i1.p1 TRINITY_DN21653_c0_g1~~TRINITY_DN21653_c0_g1_i1.p1  ORF type:complete len:852 (-),score=206.10 TRINITY_DN21653_c0_g1_i1:294-2849(-)
MPTGASFEVDSRTGEDALRSRSRSAFSASAPVPENVLGARLRRGCLYGCGVFCGAFAVICFVAGFIGHHIAWNGVEQPAGCATQYKSTTSYEPESQQDVNPHPELTGREEPPDISKDGVDADYVFSWSEARNRQAAADYSAWRSQKGPGDPRYASPTNAWADSIVYNIVVDRFNNGDTSNDGNNVKKQQREQTKEGRFNVATRHGGDLKGIQDRLPYLADFGVNVLWITPVFQHDGSYHGYCSTDPTKVDSGFGTNEDLRELVYQAHQVGIRIVLDIVINHLCDSEADGDSSTTHYQPERHIGDPKVEECSKELQKEHDSGLLGPDETSASLQADMVFSEQFFPALKERSFFNRCGPLSGEQMDSEEPETVYGDFATGMFDYNTRDRNFQRIFTSLMQFWIAYADVDGFRLDAAKHVTEDFIAYLSTMSRKYASSLGKTNFFLVGEVAGRTRWQALRLGTMSSDTWNDPNRNDQSLGVPQTVTKTLVNLKEHYKSHEKFPYPGLNAVYNFYEAGKGKAALVGFEDNGNKATVVPVGFYFRNGLHDMSSVVGQLDDCCADSDLGCTPALNHLWNLLEIHDWPRFLAFYPTSVEMGKIGFAWLMTVPGQPVIFYGQEQGFNGQCEGIPISTEQGEEDLRNLCKNAKESPGSHAFHPLFRQDMFAGGPMVLGSAVSEVNDLANISLERLRDHKDVYKGAWEDDPMLRRDHELFVFAKRLIGLKKKCPALTRGSLEWDHSILDWRDPRALIVFTRAYNDVEMVVLINPKPEDEKPGDIPCSKTKSSHDEVYQDLLSGDEYQAKHKTLGGCKLVPKGHEEGAVAGFKVRVLLAQKFVQQSEDGVKSCRHGDQQLFS